MFPYKELATCLDLDIAAEQLIGDEPITSDLTIRQIRCLMLRRSFLKKLCPNDALDPELEKLSLEAFVEYNQQLPDPEVPFSYPAENCQDDLFWDYFRSNLNRALDSCDDFGVEQVNTLMSTGPGAAIGAFGDDFYSKLFLSPLSYTQEYQLALYRAAVCYSDTWIDAERQRFDLFGVQAVPGNRLFFVNKNIEELRTCATEASVAMLLQKAYGRHLEKVLEKSFGISLKEQPELNRELARLGSIDGSFGTIDSTKASDSTAWALCLTAIDPRHVKWLRLFRAESTVLPDGSVMPLRMVSTMGNGFTFPLMTLFFAATVRSVYQMMDLPSSLPKPNFGVFGDDIVVRKEAYNFVVRCLTKLGYKVNESKSFNTGLFRESCGFDAYAGTYVRGVYIKSLETSSELYSAINRLNRWSALTGVSLHRTVGFLMDRVATKHRFLIPPSESDDSGVKIPFTRSKPKVTSSYWFSYKMLRPVAKRIKVPSSVEESRVLGQPDFNPAGLTLTFLGGFMSSPETSITDRNLPERLAGGSVVLDAYIGLRDKGGRRRYKVVRASIPFWDWEGPTAPITALAKLAWYGSYDSWKDSVARNLSQGAWGA